MYGIERYKRLISLRRVLIAQLAQIVLAKIAVNASFVRAFPVSGIIFADGLRAALATPGFVLDRLTGSPTIA